MKILTIGNMYPPHSLGGYELVWQSAVEHLRANGHELKVLTTGFHLDGVDAGHEQDVARNLEWYWDRGEWPRLSLAERLRRERSNAEVFHSMLTGFEPDVICFWAMGGMSLSLIESARLARVRLAFVVCDDWLLYAPEVDGWMRANRRLPWARPLIERVTGIPARLSLSSDAGPWLFPSETVRARALAAGWEFDTSFVCHQGVDRTIFPPAPAHEWSGRLLYVGRLDPRKGPDLAIRAVAALGVNYRLDVVGQGDAAYEANLRALARELRVERRVTFATSPHDRLGALYASADALLFPVRWQEPWGLVPLEAMSVGLPVIATGRGGSSEYLEDGRNCILFDPDDGVTALARAVELLAADPKLRATMREEGYVTTASFEADDFNLAVAELMQRATS